jgi:hypothetical protein
MSSFIESLRAVKQRISDRWPSGRKEVVSFPIEEVDPEVEDAMISLSNLWKDWESDGVVFDHSGLSSVGLSISKEQIVKFQGQVGEDELREQCPELVREINEEALLSVEVASIDGDQYLIRIEQLGSEIINADVFLGGHFSIRTPDRVENKSKMLLETVKLLGIVGNEAEYQTTL